MITVEYCKVGVPVPDFNLNETVDTIIGWLDTQRQDLVLHVSTSNIISALRLAVVKGKISPKQIQFKFGDEILKVNKYGAIASWPEGFADIEATLCEKILTGSINIRKRERLEKQNGNISKDII